MGRNLKIKKLAAAAFLIIAVILIIIPIKFPFHISTRAKLIPANEWYLIKSDGSSVFSSELNNKTGLHDNYKVRQFERGDAIEIKMKSGIAAGKFVNEGDTLASIFSNELQLEISRIKNNIQTDFASLSSLKAEEKPAAIDYAKAQLEYAKRELVEKQRYFDRQKKLLESNVSSVEDYELAEGDVELAKLNIQIAEKQLEIVSTGARSSDINYIKTRITGFQNELSILETRFREYYVIAPISGFLQRMTNSDTVAAIYNTSNLVWLAPIPVEDLARVNSEQKVKLEFGSTDIISKIINKNLGMQKIAGKDFILISGIIENAENLIPAGYNAGCNIYVSEKTLLQMIIDFFSSWVN